MVSDFEWICYFLYVLLDEVSLTLLLAVSVIKRYIRSGVFMYFKGTESQIQVVDHPSLCHREYFF